MRELDYASGLSGSASAATALAEGLTVGSCSEDRLTVTNPGENILNIKNILEKKNLSGGASPPVICGYNSGQHMWIPASPQVRNIIKYF